MHRPPAYGAPALQEEHRHGLLAHGGARHHPGRAAATRGPGWRQELNEALEDFESLRHQVRVTFLTLAQEQGTSISEAGRMLGISRQLASRVAAEADD